MKRFIEENFRDLAVLGLIIGGYFQFTDAEWPSASLPEWWGIAVAGAVIAGIAALFATGKIDDLIPDPPKVHLLVINASETERIEEWELSPDKFSQMEVVAGTLNELSETQERAYECYHYNPEQNVAVGTWRESKPASEIVGHHETTEALAEIEQLRSHLEPMAREGRNIKRHLPAILRDLDRERAEAQNSALSEHLTPNFGGTSTEDVIDRHLPDDLQPARMREQDAANVEAVQEQDGEVYGFDLLEQGEALEPLPENGEEQ